MMSLERSISVAQEARRLSPYMKWKIGSTSCPQKMQTLGHYTQNLVVISRSIKMFGRGNYCSDSCSGAPEYVISPLPLLIATPLARSVKGETGFQAKKCRQLINRRQSFTQPKSSQLITYCVFLCCALPIKGSNHRRKLVGLFMGTKREPKVKDSR